MIIGTGQPDQSAQTTFERLPGFPYWTIGVVLRGSVTVETRGGTIVHRGPSIALTPPRTPYRIAAGELGRGWSEVWVIFAPRPEWLTLLEWPEILPGMLSLDAARGNSDFNIVIEALIEVHRLATGARVERLRFAENQLERALLLAHAINPHAPHARRHPAVRKALQAIDTRFAERLDVAALARIAGCSVSQLSHRFPAEMGTTPMAYLEAHRIERAKHLLTSSTMAVKEVSAAVGFVNPFHFSTRFRRVVGCSPMVWRLRRGE
ncbi:MAG: helix-turn-helix domain-containing protein [Planctomycetes bacterium]|nr:helix-turn-helix domain-containing protein [Planctomycetota bacterium]